MKHFLKRAWDNISYLNDNRHMVRKYEIDKRSNYIIHISNGTIRYDYERFDSWVDAVLAEYNDFGAESARIAMDCVMSCHSDAIAEWNKFVKLGFIKQQDFWKD